MSYWLLLPLGIYFLAIWVMMWRRATDARIPEHSMGLRVRAVLVSPLTYPFFLISYIWGVYKFNRFAKKLGEVWKRTGDKTIEVETIEALRAMVGTQVGNKSYIRFPEGSATEITLNTPLDIFCNFSVIDLSDAKIHTTLRPAIRLFGQNNCILNPGLIYPEGTDLEAFEPVGSLELIDQGLVCAIQSPTDSNTLLAGLTLEEESNA
jgi:hypothetical protein